MGGRVWVQNCRTYISNLFSRFSWMLPGCWGKLWPRSRAIIYSSNRRGRLSRAALFACRKFSLNKASLQFTSAESHGTCCFWSDNNKHSHKYRKNSKTRQSNEWCISVSVNGSLFTFSDAYTGTPRCTCTLTRICINCCNRLTSHRAHGRSDNKRNRTSCTKEQRDIAARIWSISPTAGLRKYLAINFTLGLAAAPPDHLNRPGSHYWYPQHGANNPRGSKIFACEDTRYSWNFHVNDYNKGGRLIVGYR